MTRPLTLLLFALGLLTAGCGHTHPKALKVPAPCPQASGGHGTMGACAPATAGLEYRKGIIPKAISGETYPDLSNNTPVTDHGMQLIAQHGHKAVYLKVNQGTGFIDHTFAGMAASARRHGLAVGGYDFVSCYCAAEARLFVKLLRQAGQTRTSAGWMPPTLDIEYANANRAGIETMVRIVRAAFGRVNIYTGQWYWTPRLGCYWPTGVSGWLAGYPTAPRVCGLHPTGYTQHQYTDRGFNGAIYSDMSVWLSSSQAFKAFRNLATPTPTPMPVHRTTLGELYHRRRSLRRVLTGHGCRTTNRHTRRCRVWFTHGDTVGRQIAAAHHRGIY